MKAGFGEVWGEPVLIAEASAGGSGGEGLGSVLAPDVIADRDVHPDDGESGRGGDGPRRDVVTQEGAGSISMACVMVPAAMKGARFCGIRTALLVAAVWLAKGSQCGAGRL